MKKLIFGMVLLGLAAYAIFPASKFHGHEAINLVLHERLFVDGSKFSFSNFVGSPELSKLLGHYSGDGFESGFRNGDPNPTNMALWHLAFSSLANWLSQVCDSEKPADPLFADLRPEVMNTLTAFCAWPADEASRVRNLEALWATLILFDAPEAEFTAWRDQMLSAAYDQESGKVLLQEAVVLAFLNPHFLLRK